MYYGLFFLVLSILSICSLVFIIRQRPYISKKQNSSYWGALVCTHLIIVGYFIGKTNDYLFIVRGV